MTFTAFRCACGKGSVGRGCARIIAARRKLPSMLGIPHTLLDLRAQFVETVVKPFAQDYLHGRTPNPCVACNRDFKLGTLAALGQGAGRGVTSPPVTTPASCATISTITRRLLRGVDRGKDQSYFLFALSQEQLAHALFPLGDDAQDRCARTGAAS